MSRSMGLFPRAALAAWAVLTLAAFAMCFAQASTPTSHTTSYIADRWFLESDESKAIPASNPAHVVDRWFDEPDAAIAVDASAYDSC
jgi:hypothetical protein